MLNPLSLSLLNMQVCITNDNDPRFAFIKSAALFMFTYKAHAEIRLYNSNRKLLHSLLVTLEKCMNHELYIIEGTSLEAIMQCR